MLITKLPTYSLSILGIIQPPHIHTQHSWDSLLNVFSGVPHIHISRATHTGYLAQSNCLVSGYRQPGGQICGESDKIYRTNYHFIESWQNVAFDDEIKFFITIQNIGKNKYSNTSLLYATWQIQSNTNFCKLCQSENHQASPLMFIYAPFELYNSH